MKEPTMAESMERIEGEIEETRNRWLYWTREFKALGDDWGLANVLERAPQDCLSEQEQELVRVYHEMEKAYHTYSQLIDGWGMNKGYGLVREVEFKIC